MSTGVPGLLKHLPTTWRRGFLVASQGDRVTHTVGSAPAPNRRQYLAPPFGARMSRRGGFGDSGGLSSAGGALPEAPIVNVGSEAALREEVDRITQVIAPTNTTSDWMARVEVLLRLEGLVKGGAHQKYPVLAELLFPMHGAFACQVQTVIHAKPNTLHSHALPQHMHVCVSLHTQLLRPCTAHPNRCTICVLLLPACRWPNGDLRSHARPATLLVS